MDSLIIGFSRPRGWFVPFSWLIRLFLWTPYSHVYIRFHSDPYNSDLVFQASSLQVNLFSERVFTSVEYVVKEFTIPVTIATKEAVIEFAMANVGKPYNIMGVFGVLLVLVASWFGKKIPNPIKGSGDFCSQLVGQVLTEFLGDQLRYPIDVLTPKDIFNYLTATVPIS